VISPVILLSETGKLSGILLFICTLISIIITNTPFGESYVRFFHKEIGAGFITKSIEHWVNDGLMVIFFFLVGLEIKRELLKGELSNIKTALLPVFSAVGGIIFPALIFLLFTSGTEYTRGWAIPAATDIAFSLGILSILGDKVPFSLKIFLTALAIIDDLMAIIIIALFYTAYLNVIYLYYGLFVFAILVILNKLKFRYLNVYFILGIFLWFFILKSGVHATIAGVMLAFTIPLNSIKKLEHILHKPVSYIILPIFALVNTAIPINMEIIQGLISPLSLGIIFGLFLGKAIGITGFSYLADKLKIGKIPDHIKLKQIIAIGFIAGIGFTMSIFISNLSFSNSLIINESKLAVLLGSLLSAVTGYIIFNNIKNNSNTNKNIKN